MTQTSSRTQLLRPLLIAASLPLLLALAACGSESAADAEEKRETDPLVDPAPSSDELYARPNTSVAAARPEGGACASAKVAAALTPVDLIVMVDQSGSMGDQQESASFDPAKKWIPVTAAMKTFFASPSSSGFRAALSFFAAPSASCDASTYAAPEIALTSLPSPLFGATLDKHAPHGDTPTRAAVIGAITQAEVAHAKDPSHKTVIVLVTDGDPYGCGVVTSEQSHAEAREAASALSKIAPTIPTFVIGVGDGIENVAALASAGGTSAFHIDVGSPATTSAQLIQAMYAIGGAAGTCAVDVPAAPDGRALDLGKVNVAIEASGAADAALPYSADCVATGGWHFDDPKKPTKVVLCAAACEFARTTAGGRAEVTFGCTDRPDVVR